MSSPSGSGFSGWTGRHLRPWSGPSDRWLDVRSGHFPERPPKPSLRPLVMLLPALLAPLSAAEVAFTKLTLTTEFDAEGCAYADIDHDGNLDITAGCYIWYGLDFKRRGDLRPAERECRRSNQNCPTTRLPDTPITSLFMPTCGICWKKSMNVGKILWERRLNFRPCIRCHVILFYTSPVTNCSRKDNCDNYSRQSFYFFLPVNAVESPGDHHVLANRENTFSRSWVWSVENCMARRLY